MLVIVVIAAGILILIQAVLSCAGGDAPKAEESFTPIIIQDDFDRCPRSLDAFAEYFCDAGVERRFAADVISPICPEEARTVFYLFHACVQGDIVDADATALIRRIESAGCRRSKGPEPGLVIL